MNMTFTEMRAALEALEASMAEKGIVQPQAQVLFGSLNRVGVCLGSHNYKLSQFDGKTNKWIFGDDALAAASDYIDEIPSPETANLRNYMRKLADAVDYGHENNIPAEYVDPVRITQKAMSDNLLAKVEP